MERKTIDSFYEELIKQDIYQSKTASAQNKSIDKEAAKSMLDEFSTEDMETLAEELNLFSKEASEMSLEEKLAESTEKKETPTEEKKETPTEEKKAADESSTKKDEQPDQSNKNQVQEAAREDAHSKAKESAVDNTDQGTSKNATPTNEKPVQPDQTNQVAEDNRQKSKDNAADNKVNNTGDAKSASDTLDEILKEGAEIEAEIIKEAYDVALDNLTKEGFGVADYVDSKIENEKIAAVITEKAEKLAFVTGKNPLMVADDIINAISALIEDDSKE